MKKCLLLTLIFALILPSVYSIGIAGVDLNIDIDFTPGYSQDLEYSLLTTSSITQNYELYTLGDFNYTIKLEKDVLKNIAPGKTPSIKAKLEFPNELGDPGLHKVKICVRETTSETPGQVSALSAACATVNIRVLYPGKKVKMKFETENVNVHEPVDFFVRVENWGKEDINKAGASITIYDLLNQSIDTVHTDQTRVATAETVNLRAVLDTIGWAPGKYKAKAVLDYDSQTMEESDFFKIGSLSLRLINYTAIFPKEKISPIDLFIESEWNDPIENVYAEIKVNNKIMKTPSIKIGAWSAGKLTAYWDTTGLEIGNYPAQIRIHYGDKIFEKEVLLQVKEVEKTQTGFAMNTTMTVIILIVALVIINLLWFMFLNKKYNTK